MWRHVYGVDFLRVHPDVAHGLVQRLRGSALTCEEVGALAERLPRRPEGDAK